MAVQIGALIAAAFRIEHRLTKLERDMAWLLVRRRIDRPANDEPR